MALYAIADLHLPLGIDKPMDVFGSSWNNYVERLSDNWQMIVGENDTVVMPGDFSWATYLEQSYKDFEFLNKLNGRKIISKGNHDYWWTTMNKLKEFVAANNFKNIYFMHNNFFEYEDKIICGTRGWIHPAWDNFTAEDRKIFNREVIRMELSLNNAPQDREIYAFTHYPPTSVMGESNEFVEVLKKYNVKKAIYGHLHGMAHRNAVSGRHDGIEYQLVSADYLQFCPRKIAD